MAITLAIVLGGFTVTLLTLRRIINLLRALGGLVVQETRKIREAMHP